MVETTSMRSFKAYDDGTTDWQKIRDNFTDLENVIKDHYEEIKAIAQRQTFTISGMFQTRGIHTLMHAGKHVRCRPINAYALIHDNVEAEIHVRLVDISEPAKFTDSEKKGSGKILNLLPLRAVHFTQDVKVELTENRRVSVYVTFESTEEE